MMAEVVLATGEAAKIANPLWYATERKPAEERDLWSAWENSRGSLGVVTRLRIKIQSLPSRVVYVERKYFHSTGAMSFALKAACRYGLLKIDVFLCDSTVLRRGP